MEFHDYAAQETSGLVTRLLNQAVEEAVQRVRAEADAAVGELRRDLDAARRDADALRGEADALRDEVSALRGEADAHRQEKDAIAASRSELEAEAAQMRTDLLNERERADAADRDLAATVEAHAEVEAALHKAETALNKAESAGRHDQQARASAEEQLNEARASLDRALAETGELRDQVQDLRGEADRLRDDLSSARQAIEVASGQDAQARAASAEELQEARGLLDLALAESTNLRADLERRAGEVAALQTDLSTARDAHDQLATTYDQLTASHDQLQSTHRQLTSDHDDLRADHDRISSEHSQLASTHQVTEEARQSETQARTDVEQQLHDARTLLDLALADTVDLKSQVDAQTSRVQGLEADLTAARASEEGQIEVAAQLAAATAQIRTLEDIVAEKDAAIRDAQVRLDETAGAEAQLRERLDGLAGQEQVKARPHTASAHGDVDRLVTLLDATVRAVDDLAHANSAAELFTLLVERLSIQFSRVALFRLKGNRLEGTEQFGFDAATDVSKVVLPMTVDSVVTRVATAGTIEQLAGAEIAERSGLPFGGSPATAVALPIQLQGETLGVIYADHTPWNPEDIGPDATTDDASLGFARLLVAQTGVLLTRHTHELKMLTELREYAALLLQEAEHMYVADSEAGKPASELRKRLKDNLDFASQLYAHRAALEGTAAAGLLDDQIALAITGLTPFAHDLGAIVGQLSKLEAEITAEAS